MTKEPPISSPLTDRLHSLKMSLFEMARETVGKQEGFFTRYVPSENAKIAKANIVTLEEAIAGIENQRQPSPDRDGLIEKLEAVAFDDMEAAEDRRILKLEEAIAVVHRFFNGRPAVPGKPLEMMTRDELLAHVRGLVEKLEATAFRASDISTALYIPLQKAIAIIKGEGA